MTLHGHSLLSCTTSLSLLSFSSINHLLHLSARTISFNMDPKNPKEELWVEYNATCMHVLSFFLHCFLSFSFIIWIVCVLCSFQNFLYDYLKKKGMSTTAEILKNEARVTGHFLPGMYASASAPFIHYFTQKSLFLRCFLHYNIHLPYNMDNWTCVWFYVFFLYLIIIFSFFFFYSFLWLISFI